MIKKYTVNQSLKTRTTKRTCIEALLNNAQKPTSPTVDAAEEKGRYPNEQNKGATKS